MKTTVAARLLMKLDAREKGQAKKKLITMQSFRIAIVLIGSYLSLALVSGILIALVDGAPFFDAIFESFSALGTVGLSRDLTPRLSLPSKILVILLMFTGRVLFPTFVVGIIKSRRTQEGDADWA
jgi:trk system potassium uptake protein TrkH